ncbi:CD40 ligand-like [Stegostoma tigrinum]|uniref:CD40 ligand-like n=1 Tax=Stegostoma tigrinum TaxID=3053191 RepID=UPI00202B638A|nr:CD40 ligand-like [Stegostoma tigrinum]
MLRGGHSSLREGTVFTVSAAVENMNEASRKSPEEQRAGQQQASIAVRAFIYLLAAFLLAHMVSSALLYVYFSIKLQKVQDIMNTEPESMFLQILKKCESKDQIEKNKHFCEGERYRFQHFLKYLVNNTEEHHHEGPRQEMQIGNHPAPTIGSIIKLQRTAAHLIATNHPHNRPETNFPNDKGKPIKQWMAEGFPAFTHNINYTSGKLVITEPGFYYVYCQVSFRLSSNTTLHSSNAPFLQYIYLQRMKEQTTLLMKASKTPVDKKQAASFNSINQGGVFQLKTGDKLFVTVTDPELLSYDSATYFGIFQL